MHITVERISSADWQSPDMVLARFTIQDADPDAYDARDAIEQEVKALPHLNRTLLDLEPITTGPKGGPDDVWVTIPMPRLLVEDLAYNLAHELAPQIAEAYVYTLANRARGGA